MRGGEGGRTGSIGLSENSQLCELWRDRAKFPFQIQSGSKESDQEVARDRIPGEPCIKSVLVVYEKT